MQAQKRCIELEAETHELQTQLSTQDAELAELQVRVQAAEAHATRKAAAAKKSQQEEEQMQGKAMQANTRKLLLAQVQDSTYA